MNNYYSEYKNNKVLLLKLLWQAQNDMNYINKNIETTNEINLNDFSCKKYISELLNLDNDIIDKQKLLNIIENIKKEKKMNIDYEKENKKILLGFIYIIEDSCKFNYTKDYIEELKKKKIKEFDYPMLINSVKLTKNDIDENGLMHMYASYGPIHHEVWEKLSLESLIIPKSTLDEIKQRLINEISNEKTLY